MDNIYVHYDKAVFQQPFFCIWYVNINYKCNIINEHSYLQINHSFSIKPHCGKYTLFLKVVSNYLHLNPNATGK